MFGDKCDVRITDKIYPAPSWTWGGWTWREKQGIFLSNFWRLLQNFWWTLRSQLCQIGSFVQFCEDSVMFQGLDVKIKGEMLEDFNKNNPNVGQGRPHAGFVGFKHGCHTVKTRRQSERPPSCHVTREYQSSAGNSNSTLPLSITNLGFNVPSLLTTVVPCSWR